MDHRERGIRWEQGAGSAAIAAEQAEDVSLALGGEGEGGKGQGKAREDKHVGGGARKRFVIT